MLGFDECPFRAGPIFGGYLSLRAGMFKETLRPSCIGFCWLANLKQGPDGCGLQAGDNFLLKLEVSTTPGGFLFFLLKFPSSFIVFHCLKWEIPSSFTFFFKVGTSPTKIQWLIHPDVERSGGKCFFRPEK